MLDTLVGMFGIWKNTREIITIKREFGGHCFAPLTFLEKHKKNLSD